MSYLKDLAKELDIELGDISKEGKIIISLLTKWTKAKVDKVDKKYQKKIKYLEKEIDKLKKMKGGESPTNTGGSSGGGAVGAPAPPPQIKKGPIQILEYSDLFLVTGNTFSCKNILKSEFGAKWTPSCRGWRIMKSSSDEKPDEYFVTIKSSIDDYIEPSKFQYSESNKGKTFGEVYGEEV